MIVAWVRSARIFRFALLDGAVSIAIGLGINRGIGLLWTHPRPFAMGLGNQLLPHGADSSFPSDHGTLMFALALSLLFNKDARKWGATMLAVAFGVAWSRIYLGVHFPADMAGSFVVATASAGLVAVLSGFVLQPAYPMILGWYETILRRLHLPVSAFPRAQ